MKKLIILLFGLYNITYANTDKTVVSDNEIDTLLHESSLTKSSSPTKLNKSPDAIVKSQPISSMPTSSSSLPVTKVTATNLDSVDNMSNDILYKKRQLEQEKLNAEIKKARLGEQLNTQSQTQISIKETAQTVVTGVAIDNNGRKIAWLQFADGGSLTVNLGSQVGEYHVSSITMSTVTLSKGMGKKSKHIILKRSYVAMDKNNNRIVSNTPFNPSPIVTGANLSGINQTSEVVPPIVGN